MAFQMRARGIPSTGYAPIFSIDSDMPGQVMRSRLLSGLVRRFSGMFHSPSKPDWLGTLCSVLLPALFYLFACMNLAEAAIPAMVTTWTGTPSEQVFSSPNAQCNAIYSYWAGRTDSCGTVTIVLGCPTWGQLSAARTIKADFPNSSHVCPSAVYSYDQVWNVSCPANSSYDHNGQCVCATGYKQSPQGYCYKQYDPPKCNGSCEHIGDPVDPGTGSEFNEEIIFESSSISPLRYRVDYNSRNVASDPNSAWAGIHGALWTGEYERSVHALFKDDAGIPRFAAMYRPDGRQFGFQRSGTTNDYFPEGDVDDRLTRLTDSNGTSGWRYVTAGNDTELYDANGKLTGITYRNGTSIALQYSTSSTPSSIAPHAGLLIGVTDNFGRTLALAYDAQGRVIDLADPAGNHTSFSYDGPSGNGAHNNLTSITYADGHSKVFYYNELANTSNTNLPNHLTGIVDENGARYATYQYAWWGGVVVSEHAGGAARMTFSYAYMAPTTVTDALGTSRVYTYQEVLGVLRLSQLSQPCATPGCSGTVSRSTSYDANGNVASTTDFNGNKTCYGYDLTRNLETARVEGLASSAVCSTMLSATTLTAPARKISTQWHATYRLPLKIAEPKKLTTFTYDTSGNLLTRTEQATTDTSGVQGFTATATGTARTWTYTYNSVGQVLTVDGPRTDVTDVTTYTYTSGNLTSITDAAGNVTTLSSYDANGRVGHIVAADGKTTDLTYSPRGWLTQVDISDGTHTQTTGYTYDNVGQLTVVTLPDGGTLTYTYDDAHRLTDVTDNQGNTVHYVLDNMGNRTTEQVKDPGGNLTRQITRVYDALNRLQTITGGLQ